MNFLRNNLEPRILVIVASFACTLWAFIEVTEEVIEGNAGALDRAILLALRMPGDPAQPLGPLWLEAVARDITALGSITVLGLIVAIVTIFLLLVDRRRMAWFVLSATTSGALAAALLKNVFARPRPDLFAHGDYVVSTSFPSGHAMISAVVYMSIGALVTRLVSTRTLKLFLMSVALTLTGLIGISRVYLGVHWPSDVLAGWAAGAAWAIGWWAAFELLMIINGGKA